MTSAATSPFDILADYEQRSLAHEAGAPEEIEARGMWRGIGFRLGQRQFLSSINEVAELLVMPTLTMVPGTRPWVLGIANVRGNLAPVIDLGQYLHERKTQLTNRSRVLLIHHPGTAVGVLVDEVLGQRSLSQEQLAGLEQEHEEPLADYVAGTIQLGDQRWAVFSMTDLIGASQFQQAAV